MALHLQLLKHSSFEECKSSDASCTVFLSLTELLKHLWVLGKCFDKRAAEPLFHYHQVIDALELPSNTRSTTLSQKESYCRFGTSSICRSWSMRGCQYSTLCYFEPSTFTLRSYCVPLSASPIMSPALWGLVQDRLPLSFLPVFYQTCQIMLIP